MGILFPYHLSPSPIEKTTPCDKKIHHHPIPHKVLRRKLCREKFISPLSPHKMSNTVHNIIDNNNNNNNISSKIIINNNNNNNRTNGTQACAACKYQRRKCASDCLLSPYFPHHLHHEFLNAHRLFGVSNITKIIRHLPQPQKDEAMRTIKLESNIRAFDPVGGSCRIIRNLQRQLEFACAELELVRQQLAICKAAAAAADTVSHMCDLDPQTQTQLSGIEGEDVIIRSHNIFSNGIEDKESNANKVADEDLSPIREQTQQQSQGADDDIVTIPCDTDENNEKDDVGIEEYFLEGDDVIKDENNNVVLSFQDMETSWAMQDALVYCLQGKEGFVNEYNDLKPNVVDVSGERLGRFYCNDEPQIFEHSDEAISKDDTGNVQEEIVSCTPKDDKSALNEGFVTVEDVENDNHM